MKWIGVKSIEEYRTLLEAWGEFFCEIEKYASTLFCMEDKVKVSARKTVYGGLAYSISAIIPEFATVRYGTRRIP